MRSAHSEEQLLDSIYNAAVRPELWTHALEQIVARLGGENAALTRMNVADGRGAATAVNNDNSVLDDYFSYYFRINPLQLVSDTSTYVRQWKLTVLRDEDWMPREALELSEYYNDFLVKIGAEWGVMIRLGLHGLDVAGISVGRSMKRGRFDDAAVAEARRLQPHLVRAYQLSEKLSSLDGLRAGLAAGLDRSSSAMLLLDGQGRILHANAPAESLLAKSEVLTASNGRLVAVNPHAAQPLGAMIARAADPAWERRSAGSVLLRAPGRRLPLTVTAAPLRLEQAAVFAHGTAILLCVTDPVAGSAPSKERLAEMFALTAAESRLVLALLQGLNLRQVSARHNISINTARVQLASIFAKTGTHRQAELIKLMMTNEMTIPSETLRQ